MPLGGFYIGNCAGTLLVYAFLGLVFGAAWGTTPYWARRSANIVLTARYYADHPSKTEQLPLFPKTVLAALLAMWIPILRGWCSGLFTYHPFFGAGLTLGTVSSGACLLAAFSFQQAVEAERLRRIEGFMSDPSAPVPPRVPGMDSPPPWLTTWSWVNLGIFAILVVVLLKSFVAALQTG